MIYPAPEKLPRTVMKLRQRAFRLGLHVTAWKRGTSWMFQFRAGNVASAPIKSVPQATLFLDGFQIGCAYAAAKVIAEARRAA